jgi:hypothetical protein
MRLSNCSCVIDRAKRDCRAVNTAALIAAALLPPLTSACDSVTSLCPVVIIVAMNTVTVKLPVLRVESSIVSPSCVTAVAVVSPPTLRVAVNSSVLMPALAFDRVVTRVR